MCVCVPPFPHPTSIHLFPDVLFLLISVSASSVVCRHLDTKVRTLRFVCFPRQQVGGSRRPGSSQSEWSVHPGRSVSVYALRNKPRHRVHKATSESHDTDSSAGLEPKYACSSDSYLPRWTAGLQQLQCHRVWERGGAKQLLAVTQGPPPLPRPTHSPQKSLLWLL